MEYKIFFSWHSDLNQKHHRHFIWDALEAVKKTLHKEWQLEAETELEQSREEVGKPVTSLELSRGGADGFAGAVNIADAIFTKIRESNVFIADVTIINSTASGTTRPTPNPNVLVELGYAASVLGWERILLVANIAYGKPENLPFDIRSRNLLTYNLPEELDSEKTKIRRSFEGYLKPALLEIFKLPAEEKPAEQHIVKLTEQAIRNQYADQELFIDQYWDYLIQELDKLDPPLPHQDYRQQDLITLLIEAIESTKPLVVEFASIAKAIAATNSPQATLALYSGFRHILERYTYNLSHPAMTNKKAYYDFDFYRFLGHELFVTLFSFLVSKGRWEIIAELLNEDFRLSDNKGVKGFDYASQVVESLNGELSPQSHFDLLEQRHTTQATSDTNDLANLVPLNAFREADYFLFLRGEFNRQPNEYRNLIWRPWSNYNFQMPPTFIERAKHQQYAQKLLNPLGIPSIEQFRQALKETAPKLGNMVGRGWGSHPLEHFDYNSIGRS